VPDPDATYRHETEECGAVRSTAGVENTPEKVASRTCWVAASFTIRMLPLSRIREVVEAASFLGPQLQPFSGDANVLRVDFYTDVATIVLRASDLDGPDPCEKITHQCTFAGE